MSKPQKRRASAARPGLERPDYRGRQTKTGNSLAFRFDRALFKSHPEFNGELRASVIAPGRLLVSAETAGTSRGREDQVVAAFLAFLAQEMRRAPQDIKPLAPSLARRMKALVKGVRVSAEEDLGDKALL